jgi:hypothetical protein
MNIIDIQFISKFQKNEKKTKTKKINTPPQKFVERIVGNSDIRLRRY